MRVDLDIKALITLVKGVTPYYSVFENALISRAGRFYGGFEDKWEWGELSQFSDRQLWDIYLICRKSWENANN